MVLLEGWMISSATGSSHWLFEGEKSSTLTACYEEETFSCSCWQLH